MRFRVEEMNDYVRKGNKIPKSFDEAQRVVDGIQQQYREMVFYLFRNYSVVLTDFSYYSNDLYRDKNGCAVGCIFNLKYEA